MTITAEPREIAELVKILSSESVDVRELAEKVTEKISLQLSQTFPETRSLNGTS